MFNGAIVIFFNIWGHWGVITSLPLISQTGSVELLNILKTLNDLKLGKIIFFYVFCGFNFHGFALLSWFYIFKKKWSVPVLTRKLKSSFNWNVFGFFKTKKKAELWYKMLQRQDYITIGHILDWLSELIFSPLRNSANQHCWWH